MKKLHISGILKAWIIIPSLFILSGCIEIIEEITVREDKTGTVLYRLETNQAGGLLSGLAGLFDMSVDDNIRKEAEKLIRELEAQDGISNIHYNLPGRTGDYFLQFDFSNSADFNRALYAVSGNKKTIFSPGYLKVRKNGVRKFNFSPWLARYLEKEEIEIPASYITDNIAFRSVIHTPDDIIRVRADDPDTRHSLRQSTQHFQLTDILGGKARTGIRLRY